MQTFISECFCLWLVFFSYFGESDFGRVFVLAAQSGRCEWLWAYFDLHEEKRLHKFSNDEQNVIERTTMHCAISDKANVHINSIAQHGIAEHHTAQHSMNKRTNEHALCAVCNVQYMAQCKMYILTLDTCWMHLYLFLYARYGYKFRWMC